MRRLVALVLAAALATGVLGCSPSAEKGKNRDRDQPKPPEQVDK